MRGLRSIPLKAHIAAIREHGTGEGHMAPRGRKPRTKADFLDRAFRRHFKGLVGT
jgi:hypothetical protein